MKNLLLMLLGILPLATFAQSRHYTVDVHLKDLNPPTKAYLMYTAVGKNIVDSTISKNGIFQFQGALSEITKAQLLLDHTGRGRKIMPNSDVLSFYLEAGQLQIKGSDSVKRAAIIGSDVNNDDISYTKLIYSAAISLEKIRAQAYAAQKNKDETNLDKIGQAYGVAANTLENLQLQFIKQHPESYISLVVIREMSNASLDLNKIEPLYNGLSKKVKDSPSGLEFAKAIALEKTVAVGAMAPAFTQNDVNGKPVSLTGFKGKYVLVDFWASWCGPCRAENPNVVKAFQKYQEKNFTVIGISLDADFTKANWIKAIKEDGLDWTQLSDLKFSENEVAKRYAIKSIPQNVMIDPSGKIIGKNLRGAELNNKLKEIFGF